MLHLAISVMLIWVAINIAFVVLRLRATRSPHGERNLKNFGNGTSQIGFTRTGFANHNYIRFFDVNIVIAFLLL